MGFRSRASRKNSLKVAKMGSHFIGRNLYSDTYWWTNSGSDWPTHPGSDWSTYQCFFSRFQIRKRIFQTASKSHKYLCCAPGENFEVLEIFTIVSLKILHKKPSFWWFFQVSSKFYQKIYVKFSHFRSRYVKKFTYIYVKKTLQPTVNPTDQPTLDPTDQPTKLPTDQPTTEHSHLIN